MHFFLMGLGILLGLLLIARLFVSANTKTVAQSVRRIGGYGLFALAALFAVTGQIALAIPAAFFGMMILRGRSPFAMGSPGNARKSSGQQSRVRTVYLEMLLDHDTGEMDGVVLKGRNRGEQLSKLGRAALFELLAECQTEDQQSAQLLAAYLDRMDPDWRDHAGTGAGPDQERGSGGGPMTVDEAYDVLGLGPGASKDDIRRAHRSLMKKMHPDQGGSTYLAAKINQAKDLLLGE